jgi:hypothetical protein
VVAEDGKDAGVKKPVAVPKNRKVPSGNSWATSKLQVTSSPCRFPLETMSVSDIDSPPVGVNWTVTSRASGTKTAVPPLTWAGLKSPMPLTTTWIVCPLSVDRVGGGALGKGRQHQDP